MQSIEIIGGRDGQPRLVQRRHDLSGTDYDHITRIDENVAAALDDRGVCVWDDSTRLAHGRPALVIVKPEPGAERAQIEIRADGADPTTVMIRTSMPACDARCCVPAGETTDLNWMARPSRAA